MPFANPEEERAYRKRYVSTPAGKASHQKAQHKHSLKLKEKALKIICGSPLHCECLGCHTTAMCFLSVDHKDGRGHKEHVNIRTGKGLWLRILRLAKINPFGIKQQFQVLCMNCNTAKRTSDKCPMHGEPH